MIIRVVVNQTKIEERIEYLLEKLFSPSQSDFYEELIKWTIIKIVYVELTTRIQQSELIIFHIYFQFRKH